MRKGFKGFMNKVFKVVWSKSKECYVVVPEIAKNNSGKKKVLASVLAGLAVAGAMGGIAPQQAMAGVDTGNSHVNIWADTSPKSNGQNYNVGQNSIVVGYQNTTDNVAGHDGKVAIGAKNTSTNNASTAVGNENKATGGAATAVGAGNTASGKASVALGNVNNADAKAAIAIGTYNNVNYTKGSWQTTPKHAGEYSTVVGNYSSATGTSASAMGVYTNATGAGSFAAGYNNNANGQNSVAIGSENTSHVADTVTLGQFNNAKTMGGISIGKNNLTDSSNDGRNAANTRDENSQIAIGRDNVATHLDTIAIGRETTASGSGSTVVGARAEASGDNSIAIGQSGKGSPKVIASGVNSIAIGMQSQATGEAAIAEGAGSRAGGKYGVALGRTTKANAEAATALGNAAEANIANGVALGSSSVTTTDKGVLGYNPSDLHERKYDKLTGNVQTATTAAVSIGNGKQLTRQLTGLAAGTADTDAVNVAQLKNVGVAVTGNTGSSDFLADGGKLNVIGEGRVSTVAAHDGKKDSKITVGFDDKGMVKAGKNVKVDEVTVNGRTTYTINAADAAAKYDFLTNAKANGGKLDGTATATKVESGQTVTYAAGKNLTVKQDINQSAGEQTYTYSLDKDLKEITSITNNGGTTMNFGPNNISITGGNLDLGGNNITNLKSGGDTINNAANIGDVIRISKANDLHIAPTAGTNNNVAEYTVDANKKVTLTYQDGNGNTVTGPKAVIDLSGLKTGDMSSFNVKSSATEGKVAQGSAGVQEIRDGKTVEMQAGKNMTIKQTNNNGNAAVEFSLNKNVDLTPDGSLKIGDTNITDNGLTINNGPSITKTGINAGDLNITNVKAGVNDNDAVNVSQLKKVRADERHIKPGEYAVDNNGKVTMTYLDGNNKDVPNETAVITGIAKQDLSNINKGGETVIQNLAKKSIDMENGKNTKVSNREINGVKTFKVDVEGDLNDITSITNKAGDGKVVFGGNQTVNVAGDHNINLNAKVGDITGLTNVTLDAPDFAKKGRAATEEQLSIVNNGFNNTVGLTGNTGATDLQKLNQAGGLSFGVIGANNGQYIKTTASGSNVAVDLSDEAKGKLNNTVEVRGKNAAKVTSVTENTVDGGKKTIYTVDVDNVTPTAASTEKVKAKADSSATDRNIAKVTPQAGDQYGDAGATYEVNVSRNDVKDAAREAVTVNTTNTTNNPITVTPVQDETNHNTTYTVTFDGDKAAKQIPLTYKANGQNAQTVTLDKGLNFTNGRNTTASVDAEGVVKYDVNKDLVNINSISNTTNGPKMEFGPNSINITNGPINMGDQNITNLKSGGDVINNAANIGDVKRISKENDLHIAPTTSNRQGETTTSYAYDAASKSVTLKYNDGNGTTQAGTVAKIDLSGLADQIKDGYSFSTDAKGNVVGNHAVTPVANGKTVSYAAGKNLTVAQNIDNATGEHTYTYALSNDVDLTPNGSLKIGDTIVNNGGLTITGGPSITKTGINAGNLNITNVKAGVNNTDAVNVQQLKDARTVVTSNDNSVTINKKENGNQVTYDLHVAPGAAQSVWNVKSTGNTTADSETTAKTISDGKTVEMAAGKNLTVKQTSNNDGAKVEFDLANDIKIGKDGKDGVDGKIGVNGKDGSSVVINGKDGSIGLNGKDGKDGLTMKGEKGQPGLNGKDGITRIVYEDNNHDKHEVATLDDGLNFTGNNTDTVNKQKLNSLVKVQGEGVDKNTSATFKSAAGNINVKADGTDTLEVQLNKDLKNINTIKNGGNATFTIGGDNFAFNGGNVSIGGNNITNLKSGIVNNNDTDNTNAANIGDVKTISKANDLHIAPTTSNRAGETTTSYAYDTASKSVTLKYNDGNGANQAGTIAKIDLSGLADQIKDGYSFSTDAKGNVVGNHAVTAVGNGKTVSYAAGDNLTVKQDIDATTGEHTYTYALSNDIKVGKDGKDGIDGKIGVNGKDGSSVVINGKDGSIGLNGKDGKDGLTIRGEKGQDGVDGKNGTNGITRIVYEDHNNDKHEVATLDDGMKYAGDDAQGTDKSKVIAKKLNETMDVVGGADKSKLTDNNIGVNNVDGKLKVQLSKEVNLTPSGSLTIGDTVVNNNGLTISGGPSIIKTGINAGNLNITNVKAGVNDTDAVNVKQLKDARTVVTSNDNSVTVNKTENGNQVTYDLHVAPGAAQSVWNVKSTGNTTADSETAAKTISDGKTVEMAAGKNLTVKQTSNNDGAKVEFDLANDIKIGKDGRDGVDGKIGVNGKDGSSVVINGKDGSIGLNGKDGKDGLTMKGEKGADGVTRIVYEDHDNNKHEVATLDDGLRFDANSGGEKKNKLGSKVTVKGTGAKADSEYDSSNIKTSITQGADGNSEINIGLAKDLNNINTIKNGGNATFTIGGDNFAFNGGNVSIGGNNITNLKSGIVNNNDTDNTNAANIGDVKNISKANDIHVKDKTYTVNADKTVTLEYVDGNDNTINKTAKIDLSNLPTGDKAAVESVVKKSAAAGDTNIADITVADGKQTGDANAKYEVNVSRNAVKDAAREAVTVNTTNTTNNPITVTPVQDETNHNTTYQVTFDGEKAAKQIPLTYKANGSNNQTVTLDKGLNFTNGSNTTASVAADGVVKYDLNNNIDLTPNGSLKIGDTILNNGGLTITGGPSVTKTGINAGNLNITNVKAGVNDTDAVNVKQLKDARTVVTSNDNSVTVNKTENGNQVTYDLHVAPGAAQSVWNVKSTGNTTADSETAAKTISDGKTVEMAAGKNLTVKQTSNNDGAKVEFDLANDIKIGKDGKDGVDGKIGVNGKDGSSVVINGKDGSIGLNGKDGKDGLTMKGEKGADGVTRIVYEDNTNNKHEVATLDDGLRFDANSGGEKKNKLGSKVTVKGTGAKADSEYDSSNIKTSITQGADGNSEINIGLAKDLNNINTIKNGGPATFTIGGNEFKFDGGNVNMGGNNITNLKSGIVNNNSTDDTNGANIGDVKTISKANDLHIAPTTSDRAGETTATYAYNTADKSVTLKYNDGNGANQAGTIAKIDLSGLADQIKDGYSFSTDAKGNVVGNHAVTAVGNGKTVSYAAGDNLTIAQNIDNATGEQTYTYALSNDIKIGKDGKDGVDGKIGVNGKDGSSVVINGKDGSIGLNGKDGKDGLTMKAKDGQPGVNGKDGITRIVYEDNSKTTHEVATLDDGMKYAGDDAQGADKSKVIAKKLNETMDVVGGADKSKLTDNNIGVNNVDGKLKVQLSKEVNLTPSGSLTIGDTVVNNNGLTISGGPSITKTGINAGNKTIVNVDAGVNDTDAVNVKQLKTAKTEVKAGNNVTVDTTYGNDGHTIYTVNANDVALGDAVLKYSANGTNTQSVKLSQGLNFVDGNYTSASVDANGQVKYDVTIGKVKDGVDGKPGVDGKDGIATVKTVVDTINNSGWKGDVTGNTVNNHTATIVKPGTTVNFGAGKNLTVEQIVDKVTGDHTYNYALSDDIKVGKDGKDGVDGKIGVNGKDGSSVVINGKDGSIGLNGKDGKDGLTMKGEKGADGVTRIVYEDHDNNKHEVATLDDGLRFDANSGGEKKNKLGSKVTVKGTGAKADSEYDSSNIKTSITQGADGNSEINIGLAKDLNNINTIKNGGPATFTIGGNEFKFDGGNVNVGGYNITNVKAGVNDTDAVNVKQLKSAKTEVEEGDNVRVTSRTGADGQTIYKVSATGVNLGDAELKYSANGTNTQSVKLSKGLNFVDGNYTSASVDANGQVKYDVNLGNIKQGTDGKPGVDGKDGIATVKTVVDTINNSGWKANATGNVVGTSTATIVKPGSTVNYGAGKNLNVKQTVNGEEQTYEFALDKDLKELNSVQTNTIHLGSPTSHTTINYNAGNDRIEYTTKNGTKQVANLDDIWTIQANGTDVKPVGGKVNVVGGDYIKVSTDAAGKMTISADGVGTMNGFNVKSTGNTTSDSDKTAKNITDGKTVEFSGGKNLTVKQTNTGDGAKVEFALNNNIDLTPNGSVKIGDTVVNNDGLTITGGPTITKNNVDMGGQQIHNVKSGGDVDSNGANIGDIKRISKANDTRIKDGNYEVSQNGTVEMTYVDGSGKQLVDEHGNPVKATISGIARQDLSNITNEGKKVITGLGTIVKAGQNVSVDEATDNATGQKTYTVNADLSGAKVNASVGTEGSGVAKGLKEVKKVDKGTQYIAGDNMVVERKNVNGDDKIDNSITYSLAHDLTEINSISNGGATLRINANPGGNKYDRDTAVTPAFEVHGGNLSMTGNRIVNLAPGIDGTDGVNVNQLRDSLTTVKSTDGTVRVTDLSTDPNKHEYDLHVNPAADPRVDKLGEEIGHVGAQSAALSALKPIQYDPMEPTQIMAGYGNYRGNSALALGVAHYKNESTMFHAGVSWAGGNGHMMANAGVTWKVGNRDSEAAVADRYRKGPISSTYAMQTEVASMKAQNAGLKGEVSDLKAENEQIKAQNAGLQSEVDQLKAQMAAMMAKLGM